MAIASNTSHFLISVSLFTHYTPKINYRKLNNTNHCSSMPLLTSHTQEAFPYNRGSWHGSTSPLPAETSSQNHLALAFLPLVMLTVSLHFISINFLFAAYFLLVESHTEVSIFRVLTSSQNALFPLKSNFTKRLYLTREVCSLHAFRALSTDITAKNKFLLSFIPTNSVVFFTAETERRSALSQRSPLSLHY